MTFSLTYSATTIPLKFPCDLCILNPVTLFKVSFSLTSLRQLTLLTTCLRILFISLCSIQSPLFSFPHSLSQALFVFPLSLQKCHFSKFILPGTRMAFNDHIIYLQTFATCWILYLIWLYNTSAVTASQNIRIILIFSSFSLCINSNGIFHFCLSCISCINPLFLSLSICPSKGTISSELYYCRSVVPDSSNYTLLYVSYLTQCMAPLLRIPYGLPMT